MMTKTRPKLERIPKTDKTDREVCRCAQPVPATVDGEQRCSACGKCSRTDLFWSQSKEPFISLVCSAHRTERRAWVLDQKTADVIVAHRGTIRCDVCFPEGGAA